MSSQWLRSEYNTLVDVLEPVIDVKMKEKLATVLVVVFHREALIQNFLTDILVTEINKLGNCCCFRDRHLCFLSLFLSVTYVVICLMKDLAVCIVSQPSEIAQITNRRINCPQCKKHATLCLIMNRNSTSSDKTYPEVVKCLVYSVLYVILT